MFSTVTSLTFISAELSQPEGGPKDLYGYGGDLHDLTKLLKKCSKIQSCKA